MSDEHEKIRQLLALAAAGALTPSEEERVEAHLRSCAACASELDTWRSIAADICRLPTPQPSPQLVRITLARAEEKLAEQTEHDWNRRVMIFVVVFAWLLTAASWPVFHFVSGDFRSLLGPQFGRSWIDFAVFTALAWVAGGMAAVMLALRQRRERSLA